MPAQNRLGSNNLDRAEKAWPEPSKPDQQRPVTAVEPDTRRSPPQRHIKLMAKDEDLGFKARARLEAIDDDDRQQPQDPKHRIRSCADSPRLRESQRMRFSEGTRVSPDYPNHLSDVPCPLPRRIKRVRVSIASPLMQPSPNGRRVGIRIVTFEACSGFTRVTARRIAQPPKATFVTRLQPFRLPGRAARQLLDQSTTLWVESSSTGDPRLRGALPFSDFASGIAWIEGPLAPKRCAVPGPRISATRRSA